MEPSRNLVAHATHSTFRSLWGEEILDGGWGRRRRESSLPFSLPSFPFSPETPDTQASSLRTADTFPVVAFRRERSDDRKCVCCSQANLPLLDRRFEGANGVDRQLSNGLKFNRQPLKKVSFSPSTVRSFKAFQMSLFHLILMDVWPLKDL